MKVMACAAHLSECRLPQPECFTETMKINTHKYPFTPLERAIETRRVTTPVRTVEGVNR